jgi:hypothetical protein
LSAGIIGAHHYTQLKKSVLLKKDERKKICTQYHQKGLNLLNSSIKFQGKKAFILKQWSHRTQCWHFSLAIVPFIMDILKHIKKSRE